MKTYLYKPIKILEFLSRGKIKKMFKVGLSPSKKTCFICLIESPLKMRKKRFLFHLKWSFRSQDFQNVWKQHEIHQSSLLN